MIVTPIRSGWWHSTFVVVLSVGLCLLGLSVTARAQEYRIITFDVPGAGTTPSASGLCEASFLTNCYGTTPMANNNIGEIVGVYLTDAGVYYGFLRSPDGKTTKLSEPNADTTPGDLNGTYPMSLNSWGVVTGMYQMTDEVYHGFLREPNGHYIELDDPDAGTAAFQGTWPSTVSDTGEVAGFYLDSFNGVHGFIRSPQGKFTTVDNPNATDGTYIALEQGLNIRGAVAGWYNIGAASYGFVRDSNGKFISIEPFASSPYTAVGGINAAGSVAGYFGNSAGSVSGFLRKADGQTVILNVSGPDGALATEPFTLNSRDEVTGIALDANGVEHGLIGFANGDTKTFDAPGGGTGFVEGTRPTTINDFGQVVGWVLDSNNVAHGFIFCPK
jgi:hypothetical protein